MANSRASIAHPMVVRAHVRALPVHREWPRALIRPPIRQALRHPHDPGTRGGIIGRTPPPPYGDQQRRHAPLIEARHEVGDRAVAAETGLRGCHIEGLPLCHCQQCGRPTHPIHACAAGVDDPFQRCLLCCGHGAQRFFLWECHRHLPFLSTVSSIAPNVATYLRLDPLESEEGIRAYVPLPDWEHQQPYYGPAQFIYDSERDVYVCPEGTLLRPFRRSFQQERVQYRAKAAICNACPVKTACTASDAGRVVHRSFHAEYLERVRAYHETEEYQRAMRKRKVWIEPLFGEAKQWHGMRQFRLRGLPKVNIEGLFIAAGQNLKRLLSATGWGRRPWPDGTAGFADLRPKTSAMLM